MTLPRFLTSPIPRTSVARLVALVVAAILAAALAPSTALADSPGPYHLSGTVTGSAGGALANLLHGGPLANIEVWAKNISKGGNWQTTTDADGRYSLGVTKGNYLLEVYADNWLLYFGCYSGSGSEAQFDCLPAAIAVNDADVSGIDFSVPVTEASLPTGSAHISGVIRGPDRAGLAGIPVDVKPLGDYGPYTDFGVTTGADGSFSLEVAAPLSYQIDVNVDLKAQWPGGPGGKESAPVGANPSYLSGCYASGAAGNFGNRDNRVPCTTTSVTSGVKMSGIEVTLAAMPAPTPTPTPTPMPTPTPTPAPSVPIIALTTTCAPAGGGGSVSWSGGLEGWVFSVFGPTPANGWAGSWNSDANGGGTASPLALGTYEYAYGPPGSTTTGEGALTISVCGTPSGTNVRVVPAVRGGSAADITATFTSVSVPGETSVVISSTGPAAPDGFAFGSYPTYYDVSTTATVSGPIEFCLPYDPNAYGDPSQVQLLHWNGTSWDDVTGTVDSTKDIICGNVASLSPFVVAQRLSEPPVAPAGSGSIALLVIAVILVMAAAALWWLGRLRKRNEEATK